MKATLLTALLLTSLSTVVHAETVSFSDVLAAQETITISPIEVDGLPIVGQDLAATKVCKTAGYKIVRSFEIERAPLGPVSEAYRFEESVLKRVKVGGSFAFLKQVVCAR